MNTALSIAIQQFRLVELADLLRDKRERELNAYVTGLEGDDLKEYVRQTEEIREEFAGKREKEGL